MKIAIVPGSFDPMTLGHLDIVKRATALFDKVIVAVMVNESKKYMFSMEERLEIAKLTCEGIENVSVIADDGLLVSLAEREGACAIVKGARNAQDYVYEEKMARYNALKNPNVQTVLLVCDSTLSNISSTEVRERLEKNRDISDIVSQNAIKCILKNAGK